jgi:hypothetical protein
VIDDPNATLFPYNANLDPVEEDLHFPRSRVVH